MAQKTKNYKFTQVINAPASEVYTAFTNATALCEWLCNVSQADAHESGRLYLWWNSGYYAVGEYITLKLNEKIRFSWHGRGEPGITRVKVALKPAENGATNVKLEHADLGSGKAWRKTVKNIKRGWIDGMENLKSVLETGVDFRIARRPLLGITGYVEIPAHQGSRPVKAGVRIHGVVDGMGAHGAGLEKNDIIVKLGGVPITGQASIENALAPYRSEDKIKVQYYRDGRRHTISLVLSQRPIPEIPANSEDLADIAASQYQRLIAELALSVQGITESQAHFRISEADWSPREVIAHLIVRERETQSWIANLIEGQEADFQNNANVLTRIRATITTYPTISSLITELQRSTKETTALIAALPPEFVRRKGSYWRVGYAILDIPSHFETHINQMREIMTADQMMEPTKGKAAENRLLEEDAPEPPGPANGSSKSVLNKGG